MCSTTIRLDSDGDGGENYDIELWLYIYKLDDMIKMMLMMLMMMTQMLIILTMAMILTVEPAMVLPHLQGNIEIGRHKDRNAEVGNTKHRIY